MIKVKYGKALVFVLILMIMFTLVPVANVYATGGEETEPNDTKKDAEIVSLGDTIKGTIDPRTDVDYYKFTISKDTGLVLSYVGGTGMIKVNIKIMSEDSTTVYTGVTNYGSDELGPIKLAKGTYYLVVSEEFGANYGYSITLGTGVTGFKKQNGETRYYEEGLASAATGLVKNKADGKWYYLKKGILAEETGLVQKAGGNTWHYVVNGIYSKKTGLVQCIQPGTSKGKWYYVENGDLSKKTGLVQCIQPGSSKGKWYYVVAGKGSKETGVVQCIQPGTSKGKWYYVKKGKLNKVRGVARVIQPGSSKGKWFYVRDGKHIKSTGTTKRLDNGKRVKVINGIMVN